MSFYYFFNQLTPHSSLSFWLHISGKKIIFWKRGARYFSQLVPPVAFLIPVLFKCFTADLKWANFHLTFIEKSYFYMKAKNSCFCCENCFLCEVCTFWCENCFFDAKTVFVRNLIFDHAKTVFYSKTAFLRETFFLLRKLFFVRKLFFGCENCFLKLLFTCLLSGVCCCRKIQSKESIRISLKGAQQCLPNSSPLALDMFCCSSACSI